jgi:hypothetical protein
MVVPGIKKIQDVPKIIGQISAVSSSHKRMKKVHIGKQFLGTAPTFA